MNLNHIPAAGPVRQKTHNRPSPYTRPQRISAGNDLGFLSESTPITIKPPATRLSIPATAQKALRDATSRHSPSELSIKGAASANVVEVANLLPGTTLNDVAAIFGACGEITSARLVTPPDAPAPRIRLTYKSPAHAAAAVAKFNNQPADGNILSVRMVGAASAATGLLVRQEGSVDVLMDFEDSGSKMRSNSLRDDPRAQVLVAPPGANPAEYTPTRGGGRHGARGGRGGRRGRRGLETRMDTD